VDSFDFQPSTKLPGKAIFPGSGRAPDPVDSFLRRYTMTQSTNKPSPNQPFGDVIYRYTRAQAIEDGVLIDASSVAQEAGFRWPVALTAGVWSDCVSWSDADSEQQSHQDQTGRLWDVVFMAAHAVRTARKADPALLFSLLCIPKDGRSTKPRLTPLKLILGPGDDGEPVITILLPTED
jgi:hypothetical protein